MSARISGFQDNYFINPYNRLWQRGTSLTGQTGIAYTSDRWRAQLGGTIGSSTYTLDQQADVPSDLQFVSQSSLRMRLTNVTGFGSDGVANLTQFIEGSRFASLQGKWAALQFYIKSTQAGPHGIVLNNNTINGQAAAYLTTVTVNSANVWERKFLAIPMTGYSIGTWSYLQGAVGLQFRLILKAGASITTGTLNQWFSPSGGFLAPASGVDLGLNDEVRVDGLELVGPFENQPTDPGYRVISRVRPLEDELTLAQRFYEKSYGTETDPGTVTTSGAVTVNNDDTASNNCRFNIFFKTRKAVLPTITLYNAGTGAAGGWAGATVTTVAIGSHAVAMNAFFGGNGNSIGHWAANAEL